MQIWTTALDWRAFARACPHHPTLHTLDLRYNGRMIPRCVHYPPYNDALRALSNGVPDLRL
jgi:hypothetical protein